MIGICGAGAIGKLWAYRLGAAHCLFLSTRTENQTKPTSESKPTIHFEVVGRLEERKARHGQSVHSSYAIPYQHISEPPFPQMNAILICTKSYDAFDAAMTLDKRVPKTTPFVLFQNGLGSQQKIRERIQGRAVFAATTTSGANVRGNEQLVLAGDGETNIGPFNPEARALGSSKALNLLHSPVSHDLRFTENIDALLWRKLLINCGINAFTAIENVANGYIINTATFRELWPSLLQELCLLAPKADMEETEVEQLILDVAQATKDNISSMLQDIRSGKPTEIEDINGYAVKALEMHGHSADANKSLTRRVHALRY